MKERPLPTRLRAARLLLLEWRRSLLDSERDRRPGAGPEEVSRTILRELARFDEAREALSEAIKLALQRDT